MARLQGCRGLGRLKLRFAALPFAATLILFPNHTLGVTLDVTQSVQFKMDVPSSLCHVDPQRHEVDNLLFSYMADMHSGINKQLALFIDCPTLTAYRSGSERNMDRWAMVLLPLQKGQVKPAAGYTRSKIIDEMARRFSARIDQVIESSERLINERLSETLKETGTMASANQPRSLGIIDKDDTGVYTGIIMNTVIDGKHRVVAGVFGMTLVGEYVLSVNFYRPFVDAGTFEMLLNDTRVTIRQLIIMNEPEAVRIQSLKPIDHAISMPPAASIRTGFDWSGIVEKGLVGALVGAVFGGVAYLFGLLRKKRQ